MEVFLFMLILLPYINCYDREITITVEPGKKECFYQAAKIGDAIDIEYQVIDGDHGDLDISFELADPVGRIIFADFKKPENVHRYGVRGEGDYRLCFDNQFSTFNSKTVFFELIVENETVSELNGETVENVLTSQELYDVTVQDIMDYLGRIKQQISKVRQIQDILRSHEARDRNIAEENFFKVNAWSTFQICAMIAVGLLQVIMVKSIFDANFSKLNNFWRKIGL